MITQPVIEEQPHDGLCGADHPWQWCHPRLPWDPASDEQVVRRRLRATREERPEWEAL